MLSRVADSLYWMSRYLERAEHTARLIDVNLQLRLDQSPEAGAGRWLRLLEACQVPPPENGKIGSTALTHILTLDRTNQSSILSCVANARENLRQVREQCSTEMWEQLNRLYLQVNSTTSSEAWLLHSHIFFRAVQDGAHLFQGVTDSTMSHGEGWQYIQLGRFVERTDALARLIGTHFGSLSHPLDQAVESEDYIEWVGLLKSCAAFEAYCKTYTAELRPLRVAEFLAAESRVPAFRALFGGHGACRSHCYRKYDRTQGRTTCPPCRTPASHSQLQPDRGNHGLGRELDTSAVSAGSAPMPIPQSTRSISTIRSKQRWCRKIESLGLSLSIDNLRSSFNGSMMQ